jgi:hypothetical protein
MNLSEKNWKRLFVLAKVLLGLAFMLSGFVKAVDPWGTAYKIDDYIHAFGWTFFSGISFVASITLSAFEFFIGSILILGVYKRTAPLLVLIALLFLTPLTLYIAFANPVTDCGCFGDALVLSNTATFFKNVFLLALALFVYLRTDLSYSLYGMHTSRWIAVWAMLFPILIASHSAMHLPVFDYRPYKIGHYLPQLMTNPKGAVKDSIQTLFVYQKEGEKKTFTLENAPLEDSSWVFVERKDQVVQTGEVAPIHDFVLQHPIYGDITQEVLSDTSYVFLMVSPKLEDLNYSNLTAFLATKEYAVRQGYRFMVLTSSNLKQIEDWKFEYDESMEFALVDEITLKTIIRSNPGLVLLKKGTVLQKWGFRDIPPFDGEEKPLPNTEWGVVRDVKPVKMFGGLLLAYLIPLLVLLMISHGYRITYPWQKKNEKPHL